MAENGQLPEKGGYWANRLSRRGVLRAGAGLGVVGAMGALGLACGDDDSGGSASGSADGPIKVGILHSLSGTMAVSEVSVKDAELLAIEEVNAAGGVMGRQLQAVVEDGQSDWPTFAEKARKLIQSDKVACVFGCWTSPAVRPCCRCSKD